MVSMVIRVDHFASGRYMGLKIAMMWIIAFSGSTVDKVDGMYAVDYLP